MVSTGVRAGCVRCGCNLPEDFIKNGVHGVQKPRTPAPGFMDTICFLVSNGVQWCPKWCPYFCTLLAVPEAPPKSCIMDTMDTKSYKILGGVTNE